jgi:hypothetical protein
MSWREPIQMAEGTTALAGEKSTLRLAAKNRSFFRLMPLVIAELLDGALPEGLHRG